MNRLTPKAERKAAILSLLGLVVLTAAICVIEFSTRPLQVRGYLVELALAAASGAIAGMVLGYICGRWLTVVQHLIVRLFDRAQIAQTQIEGLLRQAGE